MPSRSSGPRSHLGCVQCKNRHVKCDETLPACNRCRRHDRKCSLSEIFESSPNSFTAVVTNSPQPSENESRKPVQRTDIGFVNTYISYNDPAEALKKVPANGTIGIHGFSKMQSQSSMKVSDSTLSLSQHDEALLARYIKVTANSMNDHEEIRPLFRDLAPALATTRPYLMYCILAIAGLDRLIQDFAGSRQTSEANALQTIVLDYQNRSLRLFQEQIHTSTSTEDCAAAALAGILILFTSMAFHQLADENSPNPVNKAAEVLKLLAGVGAFFQARRSEISESAAGILLVFYSHPIPTITLKNDVQKSLHDLGKLCASEELTMDRQSFLSKILLDLHDCFRATAHDPREVGQRLRWVSPADARILAGLLEAKCPEALLIVAHWAADFADWPGAWWSARLGHDVVEEVEQILEPHLKRYLQWPLKHIGK